jgi:hypothetical protein
MVSVQGFYSLQCKQVVPLAQRECLHPLNNSCILALHHKYVEYNNQEHIDLIIKPNPFNNIIYLMDKSGLSFNYTINDLQGNLISKLT